VRRGLPTSPLILSFFFFHAKVRTLRRLRRPRRSRSGELEMTLITVTRARD
jgi:hypothetical protein